MVCYIKNFGFVILFFNSADILTKTFSTFISSSLPASTSSKMQIGEGFIKNVKITTEK